MARWPMLAYVIAVFIIASSSAWRNVPRTWPCPTANIDPCLCEIDQANKELKVSCNGINAARLGEVFHAGFQFKSFTSLTITNSDLGKLGTAVFNGMSFKKMVFDNSGLQEVESKAFSPSYKTLESLSIVDTTSTPANSFPWPLNDLEQFESLVDLTVNGPYEAPNTLVSSSLETVSIKIPPKLDLQPSQFQGLKSVRSISLEAPVSTIQAKTFSGLASLEELIISKGDLTDVVKDAFNIDSANLVTLTLSDNAITKLEPEAIVVLNDGITIDLSHNKLTTVESEIFDPVLSVMETGSGSLNLKDNPLLCGCDLYWIVNLDPNKKSKIHGVTDSCHVTGLDMDVLNDFLQFQCHRSGNN